MGAYSEVDDTLKEICSRKDLKLQIFRHRSTSVDFHKLAQTESLALSQTQYDSKQHSGYDTKVSMQGQGRFLDRVILKSSSYDQAPNISQEQK